jgi:hypothetical protein
VTVRAVTVEIIKVWWHAAILFYLFLHYSSRHTIFMYTTRSVPSCRPHGFRSVKGLLWGVEPRLELRPALLSEPRSTLLLCTKHITVLRNFQSVFYFPNPWTASPSSVDV